MPLLFFDRLFLLPHTVPKAAQLAAKRQIIAVAVHNELCLVQAELAALIKQTLIDIHGHTFGQKQVVAAQRNDLCDLALKVYGAFLDKHGADLGGRRSGKVHGGELIHIAAALDAAPVDGPD